ncbi:uncharacterized protein LOC127080349 [Lathyrus oleraceus]|uniref:uncharacterized protein LOC127080349 n=1 Tax=Pisum sativum TaxID=3888 RepID=UPI0021D07720|nr:uncharacterized protein LOC127080349 [Pisum sativum]
MNPPEFHGGLNPMKAQEGITIMERIFQIVHCSEENKVVFYSYMMKGSAVRWWESTSTLMTNQGVPRDWENFKTIFLDKYFPSSLRTHKEFEFQQLRHGTMTVAAYSKKFEDMAAYSRQAAYAPDERWKIDQFIFGLRGEISHSASQREFKTYAELLRKCYVAENSLKKVQEERDQYRSGQRDQGRPSSPFRPRPQREGHMSRECPQNKNHMQGRRTSRVYTLDARKAKRNNALIVGTCLVNGHPCFVLFDCGATHPFVSIQCMKRLGLQVIPLYPHMVVTTAMDDVVETQLICENCLLSLNDRIFQIDLICLPNKKVGMVLRMDWLSANSVFIGCEEKLIIIPSSEATPKDVLTTIWEGTIGMVNFLFEKEKSVLLVLTKKSSDNMSVTQIPIVCEFPEVFPEDPP